MTRLEGHLGDSGRAMMAEASALRAGALAMCDGDFVVNAELEAARARVRVGKAAYGAWGTCDYFPLDSCEERGLDGM